MAVPPTVPTSFVPQQSFTRRSRSQVDLGGAFAFIAYGIFAVALLATIGVFVYQKILENQLSAKETELMEAQANIDEPTVQSLLELRDRLSQGKTLLDNHVALSSLFGALEDDTLKTVYLTSLHVASDQTGTMLLTLTGTAKSFNALAAESEVIGANPGFKDAIFSGLTIQQAGRVDFVLDSMLDKNFVLFGAAPLVPVTTTQGTSTAP